VSDPEHVPRGVAPLSVETDLSLAIGGGRADVESTGQRLLVRFHSIPDAVRAFRGRPADAGDALPALLTATDLTVEVRVRDRTVLVAGAGARAGPLSRLLGIDPAEVRIGGVVGALGAEARRLV
jgi:hypothetical protein